MKILRLLCVLLPAWLAAPPAAAQSASPTQISAPLLSAGRQQVAEFMGRMVRVTGRQSGGRAGETGYGFVVGSRPTAQGARLLIVTANHLVRDPQATAGEAPDEATLVFYGNLALTQKAEVLPGFLDADSGDLAVLLTRESYSARYPAARMTGTAALLPGSAAWEIGRPGTWDSPATPGQFSLRTNAGWLLFDGLDAQRGSAGGAVLAAQGLVGMVVGESAGPSAPVRVLPIELIATKLAEWGVVTDIAPIAAAAAASPPLALPGSRPAAPAATDVVARTPAGVAGQPGAPRLTAGLGPLLGSEAAARGSWVPANARLSPQAQGSAAVLSSPRREATRIGQLPPGRSLPPELWQTGVYEIVNKLDGGAWFLLASEGVSLGYVAGFDVIELWPASTAPAAGRVVRDWVLEGDRHAVLRDAGTHFDLTVTLACHRDHCDSVSAYTPRAPLPGAIVPGFQVPALHGSWKQDEAVTLHMLLPRRVVETKGTSLLACLGQEFDCTEVALLGG